MGDIKDTACSINTGKKLEAITYLPDLAVELVSMDTTKTDKHSTS